MNLRSTLFLALFTFIVLNPAYSQFGQPLISLAFQVGYGDTVNQEDYSLIRIDSGYVAAGYSIATGTANFQLTCFNSQGDLQWAKSFGGSSGDFGHSVSEASSGGYFLTGWGKSFGAGDDDLYVVRTDENGDLVWGKTFGGSSIDRGRSITATPDGGAVVAGHTNAFGAGLNDILLIRLDSIGDTTWTRTYGTSGNDNGWSVVPTSDGGFIVGGNTSFGPGFLNAFLLKVNNQGDTLWAKAFGAGSGLTSGLTVIENNNGKYLLTGWTSAFGAGGNDAFLLQVDANGNTEWARYYGGTGDDDGFGLAAYEYDGFNDANPGYGIVGSTESFGVGIPNKNMLLIKTDQNGIPDYSYALGDSLEEKGYGAALGWPDNFTGIGTGYFYSNLKENLITKPGRLDPIFFLGCVGPDEFIDSDTFSFQVQNLTPEIEVPGISISQPSMLDFTLISNDSVYCRDELVEVGLEQKLGSQLSIFPNPSQGRFSFQVDPKYGKVNKVELVNQLGKRSSLENFEHRPGSEFMEFELGSFLPGTYQVILYQEQNLSTCRLVLLE